MTKLISIISFIMLTGASKAQNSLFQKKEFIFKKDILRYRILFPENYNRSSLYPLVIFLHGSGERGNDNESQLKYGSSLFAKSENRENYPAIVIFPQCPENEFWAPVNKQANTFNYIEKSVPTKPMQLVIRLIKGLIKNESVDINRIYVTGISMGGMGTLDLLCRYPNEFAAANVICGGIHLNRVEKLDRIPLHLFHGEADQIVDPKDSKDVYKTLKALGNKNLKLTMYAGTGHNCWDNALAEPDFLNDLFSHRLC